MSNDVQWYDHQTMYVIFFNLEIRGIQLVLILIS